MAKHKKKKKTKVCDLCGKPFSHKPLDVYNENFVKQVGIVTCGCHIAI